MLFKKQNDIPYLTFPELSAPRFSFVRYAVSTRHGGVSTSETLGTMNMGTRTGDNFKNVQENYRIFCGAVGFPAENTVLANQTHSLNVRRVTAQDAGKGIFKERDYTDIDALITNEPNLPLSIHTADCVPVTLIDPVQKAVGNAHCGWRGTLGKLSAITLAEMHKAFGTKPEDVTALIGPCIHKCCYEVSEDLYAKFLEVFSDKELVFQKENKFFLDLPGINQKTLQNTGVQEILTANLCTCCNTKDLFSHRGLGPKRGVMSTFISVL